MKSSDFIYELEEIKEDLQKEFKNHNLIWLSQKSDILINLMNYSISGNDAGILDSLKELDNLYS
jgi:hypothetical protein